MNDSAHSANEETIIIDGRVSLEDYKIYWFDGLKNELPNALIFWGTFVAGALLFAYFLRDSTLRFSIFLMIAFAAFLIPALMLLFSYQSFMTAQKAYISKLSENEKHFNFNPNSNGFECVRDENFSHVFWNKSVSIRFRSVFVRVPFLPFLRFCDKFLQRRI